MGCWPVMRMRLRAWLTVFNLNNVIEIIVQSCGNQLPELAVKSKKYLSPLNIHEIWVNICARSPIAISIRRNNRNSLLTLNLHFFLIPGNLRYHFLMNFSWHLIQRNRVFDFSLNAGILICCWNLNPHSSYIEFIKVKWVHINSRPPNTAALGTGEKTAVVENGGRGLPSKGSHIILNI